MNWLVEDLEEAEKTGGALPNPKAPRLVKEEAVAKKPKNKKPVLLKIDEDVHKQLNRLTNLRKLDGDESATVTAIFIEGLELYLKKHKLPSYDDLSDGKEIDNTYIR
ncbi:MAG: hypothetical protein CML06_17960 [Pseudomonadales bacterium]|nr:hypothetical protein [Pseudomonadales bacterium]|tara:strand:+ start:379 stop:699 length:321 start_codon:yes stop_codon:yes gene_type:complete